MKTLAALVLVLVAAIPAAPVASALPASTQPASTQPASTQPEPARPDEGPSPGEIQAYVPELAEFHEPIFKLWHEAWPKKDLGMMSSLLPEIEAGAAKIEKAVLPGILRDKKADWDAGVRKLGGIVADYRAAVGSRDVQKAMDAGERLHSQFEALARTIRPALAEVDAFHRVLYRLYHYELPAFALPTIQATVRELKEKMAPLGAAALPARMESKKEAFEARRSDLGRAVGELAALAEAGKDEKAIRDAIEAVHRRYVLLDEVF